MLIDVSFEEEKHANGKNDAGADSEDKSGGEGLGSSTVK